MRAKRKHQTSQNSYFSLFLFTDLKLSNLKKKDARSGILTIDLLFMLVWCTLVASRLHYGTLDLYATFKIRSVMTYQINIILLLHWKGKLVTHQAEKIWSWKFGPSSVQILGEGEGRLNVTCASGCSQLNVSYTSWGHLHIKIS